jgi:hypothetical protein
MVERFFQAGDNLLAILSNGERLSKPFNQAEWQRVLPEITRIKPIAAGS